MLLSTFHHLGREGKDRHGICRCWIDRRLDPRSDGVLRRVAGARDLAGDRRGFDVSPPVQDKVDIHRARVLEARAPAHAPVIGEADGVHWAPPIRRHHARPNARGPDAEWEEVLALGRVRPAVGVELLQHAGQEQVLVAVREDDLGVARPERHRVVDISHVQISLLRVGGVEAVVGEGPRRVEPGDRRHRAVGPAVQRAASPLGWGDANTCNRDVDPLRGGVSH
mmetsp:Transcript_2870/g.6716  ORF Transcript_2870/g.6716 Transcript_2870/m.6716 type:complete len:224 (-) Transcript_2870:3292-3963(-)